MGIINFATNPKRADSPFWQQAAVDAAQNAWQLSNNFGPQSYSGTATKSSTSTTKLPSPGGDSSEESKSFFDDQPEWTYYEGLTPEEKAAQASQFRDIFYNPQAEAIERRLEQAIADASSHEGRIRANFAGYQDALGRREAEQRRVDLESAIARGAGRSGVVDHLGERRGGHFSELLSEQEAKKMAELNAISEQLGLINRQVPIELQQLAEQASRLEAQELQRLSDLDYQRRREYDQDQFGRSLQVFDRTHLTPLERLQLYLQAAEVAGMFPKQAPNIKGLMGGL